MADAQVRYCQVLLKSLPATVSYAEELFARKLGLVAKLPGSSSELRKMIVDEQKPFALKIQRHLAFFAKWDQKNLAFVHLAARAGLRNSLGPFAEYIKLLDEETGALDKDDVKLFNLLWKNEQELQYRIASFFAKSPNLKERSIMGKLHSLGKGFLSPFAQALMIVTMIVVSWLPAALFKADPVVIPPRQAEISSPVLADADSLARSLSTAGWGEVREIRVVSKAPGAPTIIIKEDRHGTPRYELDFVRHVLRKHGVNVVAMEGWAGIVQDSARGFTLLNAEEEFIKKILGDDAFFKIGLEDAALQEETLQHILINDIVNYKAEIKMWQPKLAEAEKDLEKAQKDYAEDPSKINESVVRMAQAGVSMIKGSIARSEKALENLAEWNAESLADLRITLPEIKRLHEDILSMPPEEAKEYMKEVCVPKRSRVWAQKLVEEIKNRGLKSAVVVIGQGHTASFVNALQKLGGFNIILVSSEKPKS